MIKFIFASLLLIGGLLSDAAAEPFRVPKKIVFKSSAGKQFEAVLPELKVEHFLKYKYETCATDNTWHPPLFPFLPERSNEVLDWPLVLDGKKLLVWAGDARWGTPDAAHFFTDIEFVSRAACDSYEISGDQIKSIAVTFVDPKDREMLPVMGTLFKLKWNLLDGSATIHHMVDFNNYQLVAEGHAQ
jgi:hypothetical protein